MEKIKNAIAKPVRRNCWGVVAICAAALLFFVYLGHLKQGFYVDEIFSYAHANSTVGAFMSEGGNSYLANSSKMLEEKWISGETFARYIETDSEEKLTFSHIFNNLESDVHPPLFYIMLHSLSWLTGGRLSKMPGLILNAGVLVLLLLLFYGLAKVVLEQERSALCATGVFAFLPVVLETEMFIRGYLLEMALVAGLYRQAFLMFFSKKVLLRQWVGIFVFAVFLFLTHFYGLIYGFLLTGFGGIRLWFERRYKRAVIFFALMLFSVAAAFYLYPSYIEVLFFSQRGKESVFNLSHAGGSFFVWFDFYIKQLTGGVFGTRSDAAIGWALAVAGVICFMRYTTKLRMRAFGAAGILTGTALIGALLICLCAPNMGRYNGRYYAVSVMLLFFGAVCFFKQWADGKKVAENGSFYDGHGAYRGKYFFKPEEPVSFF